ncbi:Crp/Fnr family transcriptional regulator [Sphingomonas sp. Xoc002]|uniref:Crp/Fnr family transcriptional regulator n=1 Tax=Sphingomonas sp. Xoc002 TaxID=2837624 RepID=UPI003D179305
MTGYDDDISLQPFLQRLAQLVALTEDESEAIRGLEFELVSIPRHRNVIAKGETPSYLYAVLDGWAGRYSLRPDGTRRITGFVVPGDFCGIHAVCHSPLDHAIVALTDCVIAKVSLGQLEQLVARFPVIGRALWHAKLVDEAILRIWLLNSSDAFRTLAHLLCEFEARLHPGETSGSRQFQLPVNQEHLADALGLTPVHLNRVLQRLRASGVIDLSRKVLTIPDINELRKAAHFDCSYLHAPTPLQHPVTENTL